MRRVFDIIPFFDELDILEVRLHELDSVVDRFIIVEGAETYGGAPRNLVLQPWLGSRFEKFQHKISYFPVPMLLPKCIDRTTGRLREAYLRNEAQIPLLQRQPDDDDVIIFSDCDEIVRADAVRDALKRPLASIHRFKQTSYYYNINTVVDYGHDFASRARIGTFAQLKEVGSLYEFRMANKNTDQYVVEQGGWHFGYFGSLDKIKRKVEALSPFLSEYKLFGDATLVKDIREGRDLHHRRCELPETFKYTPTLYASAMCPNWLCANLGKFKHFTREGQVG